jgi:deazaflavin-dependent oxidoreductase (nitroreductase family)
VRGDARFRLIGLVGTARWMRHLHAPVYRRLGGRGVVGRSFGNLTVVLATTGARTGRRRETAIWAYPDGESLVLIASNGGSHRLPGWCANLRARPDAEVLVGREWRPVRAREAAGAEHDRLWRMVNQAYPGYDRYLEWAGRPIPLVVLEPRPASDA